MRTAVDSRSGLKRNPPPPFRLALARPIAEVTPFLGAAQASGRRPPRRRLLYHEFEIERSPWDFWLDENEVEEHARLARRHAQLTGDCTFYHNCTAPLPPPLALREFWCWQPNVSWQPNVTVIFSLLATCRPSSVDATSKTPLL